MSDQKNKGEPSQYEGEVHVYDDDLVEEDNHLPLWWQYTLYGAVVFAACYWYAEHKINAFPSRLDAYQQEMVAVRMEQAKKGGSISAATLIGFSKTPATVEAGKQVFTTTCAACHRADAGGLIGPNLTDNTWIHGGTPEKIYETIHEGVAAKGMPAWGPALGDEKVAAVAAYVLTLKNTNVAGGKAPQGDPEQ
jgi:cytochrome c oxidase cbb3-type subunit 3